MTVNYSEKAYQELVRKIFMRFPSVQDNTFQKAYKPGLEHMAEFDRLLGEPSKAFPSIHIAGTNGKGSVANMIAAALAANGFKTALYTSPHILDFRERARITRRNRDGKLSCRLIPKKYTWDFLTSHSQDFQHLDLSFFEITTGLAFKWFADSGVDVAVIETGLGGRLDSTNIITPELSVITGIGLDHCALLGDTLEKIAYEKAGIIKPGIPAVIGLSQKETAPVFEGRASDCGSPLVFADRHEPWLWDRHGEIEEEMDLSGDYQHKNLRTALSALEVLRRMGRYSRIDEEDTVRSLKRTAAIMDFHGRWEKVSSNPDIICDIGHNPPALKENFLQLERYLNNHTYSSLTIIYGVMADKDLQGIIPLMPRKATYLFVTPGTRRALPSHEILREFRKWFESRGIAQPPAFDVDSIPDAIRLAGEQASDSLVYAGGSTFVVSDVVKFFRK